MSSLVPGYMAVSWTVSPPAVGVGVTCGVEGRPEGEGRGRGRELRMQVKVHRTVYISSPRRGLTVVLTHTVPNMLDRVMLREYSVPACSPMM